MNDIPAETSPEYPDISALWKHPLQPAHCPNCSVAHLIPKEMGTALCPACFSAQLEPQPTIIRPEPPELMLDFVITPAQVKLQFTNWLKGVWLRPKELDSCAANPAVDPHFYPYVARRWQSERELASADGLRLRGGQFAGSFPRRKVDYTQIDRDAHPLGTACLGQLNVFTIISAFQP